MTGKSLVRIGAIMFVGLAGAIALLQLREPPAARPAPSSAVITPVQDPLTRRLRVCVAMGEAALSARQCRAAWAEKRRRFFGVDYPEAYSTLERPLQSSAGPPPEPSSAAKTRGAN